MPPIGRRTTADIGAIKTALKALEAVSNLPKKRVRGPVA